MKIWKVCALCLACTAAFALATPDDAEARRLGGGRSFGGSPSMSRPSVAPRAPGGANVQQPGSTVNRQAAGAGAGAAAATRGYGGIFGGLLAGTLIGSMLSGQGFAGGGMMDIVIIGLVVYLGYRFLRGRRHDSDSTASQYSRTGGSSDSPTGTFGGRTSSGTSGGAGSAWDTLKNSATGSMARNTTAPQSETIPADFDQDDFLRGAKMAYVRLQESWDKRDLDDIAQFASPAVMSTLRQQFAEEPDPSTTELLLVNAQVMEVKNDGPLQRVAVYFDTLLREDPAASQPEQVREVWHFVRTNGSTEAWKLDGIQQMA